MWADEPMYITNWVI